MEALRKAPGLCGQESWVSRDVVQHRYQRVLPYIQISREVQSLRGTGDASQAQAPAPVGRKQRWTEERRRVSLYPLGASVRGTLDSWLPVDAGEGGCSAFVVSLGSPSTPSSRAPLGGIILAARERCWAPGGRARLASLRRALLAAGRLAQLRRPGTPILAEAPTRPPSASPPPRPCPPPLHPRGQGKSAPPHCARGHLAGDRTVVTGLGLARPPEKRGGRWLRGGAARGPAGSSGAEVGSAFGRPSGEARRAQHGRGDALGSRRKIQTKRPNE